VHCAAVTNSSSACSTLAALALQEEGAVLWQSNVELVEAVRHWLKQAAAHAVLCRAVPCVPRRAALCRAMPCRAVPRCAVPCRAVPRHLSAAPVGTASHADALQCRSLPAACTAPPLQPPSRIFLLTGPRGNGQSALVHLIAKDLPNCLHIRAGDLVGNDYPHSLYS
jgi:hypothetical protein